MSERRAGNRDETPPEAMPYSPANANQVRDEPIPASHDDEHRPDAVRRNEENAAPDGGRSDIGWDPGEDDESTDKAESGDTTGGADR
jgi:hypothetical protein